MKIVLGIFIASILFRIFIVWLSPQPFMLDQWEYHRSSEAILHDSYFNYVGSYRQSGYPMILALVYSLFGGPEKNYEHSIVTTALHILLDCFVGLMIFDMGKRLFRNKHISWIAYLLYAFNPYTSAYTGTRLTESVMIFFLTFTIYLFFLYRRKKQDIIFLIFAFIAAFTPQVRPGFLLFTAVLYIYLAYLFMNNKSIQIKRKTLLLMVSILLFISPFLYNLAANKRYFGQWSPMTVDNVFVREFYISLFIGNEQTSGYLPSEVQSIYAEYSSVFTPEQRHAMADKYMKLGMRKINLSPQWFIKSRIEKFWYVWEKHILYPYYDPKVVFFPQGVYGVNILLLILGLVGVCTVIRNEIHKRKETEVKAFVYITAGLFVYVSLVHSVTITAERFSLPAYPMICLYAGYGLYYIFSRLMRIRKSTPVQTS